MSRSRLPFLALLLLLSAVIEFLTRFFPVPIDVGYPAGTPWHLELYGLCLSLLHAPAILLLPHIDGHNALVWFVTGWLTTFCCLLLLAASIHSLRKHRHTAALTAEGRQA